MSPDGDGLASDSADFSGAFATTIDYGTDGAGSVVCASLSGQDMGSGLYALGTDGAQGDEIILSMSGDDIIGTAGGETYFTISVDGVGEVTFSQSENIWHSSTASPDDAATLIAETGTILLTQTVTDADGDTASASVDLSSGVFVIEDDGPSVTLTGDYTAPILTLDESPVSPDGDGLASDSADFSGAFATTIDYGTDGAGSVGYALSLSGQDMGSGLYALGTDGAQGDEIILSMSGDDIIGTAGGETYFTISVDGVGEVTFSQSENIWHSSTASPDDAATLIAETGTILLTQTVTDADGDTASASVDLSSGVFVIEDDGPSVTLTGDYTAPILTLDESPVSPDGDGLASDSADFSGAFATTIDYGTDGAGSVGYALSLSGQDMGSGLYALGTDGAQGDEIILSMSGDDIIGTAGGETYFTISVDGVGEVTFSQSENIWHSSTASPDDAATLIAETGTILLTQTVTDADGDTASASVDLSSGVFVIEDDGPSVTLTGDYTAPILTLDESPVSPDGDGLASDSADFSGAFATTIDYGTDGAGSVGYALSLSGQDMGSGLYALGTDGAQGDEIILSMSGDDIIGTAGGETYFTISVDGVGEVTFSQSENIWHSSTASPDDAATLIAETGTILLTQTVTDADGDTASASVDLSSGVFVIEDDGPSVTLTGDYTAPILTLDESPVSPDGDGLASDSADFSGAFATTIDYGTDGAGSVGYALSLSGQDMGSGLYALGTDGAQGDEIILSMSGDDIIGTAGGETYFTISVDGVGEVTFSQSENIWHSSTASPDDAATLIAETGTILLTQTVTDADGDTASASVDLSSGVFVIEDDGPSVTLTGDYTAPILTLDESPVSPDGDGLASDSADFSGAFATTIDYGTDGAGSVGYALSLSGQDMGSGLYALGTDGAQGDEIILSMSGDDIIGTAGGETYFTISVDGVGEVTFSQSENIWHSSTASPDDAATLIAETGTILLTQTVTDADGDTASADLDVSSGVFSIQDDGPSVSSNNIVVVDDDDVAGAGGNAGGTGDDASAFTSGTLGHDFGADGAGSIAYLTTGAPDGFTYEAGPENSLLVKQGGTTVMTLTLDTATGAYTVTQNAPIDHVAGFDENNQPFTISYQVTDGDGDKVDGTLSISVDDDTPTIDVSSAVTYTVDVTNYGDTSAGYDNSFGYYIKGAGGIPTTGVVVWDNVKNFVNGSVEIMGYTPDQVGFFIIPNGNNFNPSLDANTAVTFEQDGSGHWQAVTAGGTHLTGEGANVLFDVAALNIDLYDHVVDNAYPGNLNWEDISGGGDHDFNDINIGVVWSSNLPVLTTQDAETIGPATDTASASFSGVFSVAAAPGADGGSPTAAYSLNVTNADSGLTSDGDAIVLSKDGNDVVGTADGNEVFRISVDANGTVTLTQYAELDHVGEGADGNAFNNSANMIGLADGKISLTATATIIDGDGDQASDSQTLDISGSFRFEDDIPTAAHDVNSLQVEIDEVSVSNFTAGWVNVVPNGNVDVHIDNDGDGKPNIIEWGADNQGALRSGYEFIDNDDLTTTGGSVEQAQQFELGTFTHHNFPIPSGSAITGANLDVHLHVMIDGVDTEITHTINFSHTETPNQGTPGQQADIVQITNALDAETLVVNGQTYHFSILGFQDGNGDLVSEVHTLEGQSNSFTLYASVSLADELPSQTGTIDPNWGADGPAAVNSLTWVEGVITGDTTTIDGDHGTLVVNNTNGTYTYTLDSGTQGQQTDTFTYSLQDADGDIVDSTLTFNINALVDDPNP